MNLLMLGAQVARWRIWARRSDPSLDCDAPAAHLESPLTGCDQAASLSTSAFKTVLPEIVSFNKLLTVGIASARTKIW
jgi:hypothetical protein